MNTQAQFTEFTSPQGVTERFYAMVSTPAGTLEEEARQLFRDYERLTPDPDAEVLLRLHLSDAPNQVPFLKEFLKGRNSFVTMIGQPPAYGARIGLEAWHVEGIRKEKEANGTLSAKLDHYSYLWVNSASLKSEGSYEQTKEEFFNLDRAVTAHGGTVEGNVHRTWLYCDDIDHNYHGLVESRKEFFNDHHLTAETHYITSTGIDGHMETPSRVVKMDSLAFFGLQDGQVEYLEALDYLSPTNVYGVTFERGTRIIYGDRSSFYISGTASIDKKGDVLFIDDPRKQAERAILNIKALLENHKGSLADMKHAVVYLRNREDRDVVKDVLDHSEMAHVPYIMLVAPVCRPTWLVEIDGIGVNACGDARYPAFR